MAVTEQAIIDALKTVVDPELRVNVYDLGLIYGVGLEDAGEKTNLRIVMTMTTPACPYGPELVQAVRDALGATDVVGSVDIELTLSPPWTPDRMTDEARDQLGLF